MQIYLARNNQQAGPYTLDQLNQMLANQQVLLTDLAWHQGMQEWKALGELTQGQMVYQPSPSHLAAANPFPAPQSVEANYQNPSIQKISVEKKQTKVELASIGARFLAKIIDLSLWLPIAYILVAFFSDEEAKKFTELNEQFTNIILNQSSNPALAQEIQAQILQMIPSQAIFTAFAYIFVMLAIQAFSIAKTGQSLGKKVTKIQIVDAESQQQVNLLRAFTLRSVIFITFNLLITPFLSLIDYIFGLSKKRQTLHDKVAKTIVIKRQ